MDDAMAYFVDGYHGGIRGHMPVGAWREVLAGLKSRPDWTLCLDIECASWIRLKSEDPETFAELADYLNQPPETSRVEIVNGSFAQPFGWAFSGESNIRQIARGLEIIQEHFAGVRVTTFATQEPCWASCLPQILLSFGYENAVLKNPSTAWGGYSAGFDAGMALWRGPDGQAIRTVPRYACEDLLDVWRTEADDLAPKFIPKCIEHGIAHPVGMSFQDLGWPVHPKVEGGNVRYVTWREYFDLFPPDNAPEWRFGIEDILCCLPWGEKTIHTIAAQARAAEDALIVAEKMASLAAIYAGTPYPEDPLRRAWDKVFWSQHHDAWITATTRQGREAWAWQVASQTWDAEEVCREIVETSALAFRAADRSSDERSLRVFNTLGSRRTGIVEIEIPTPPGTRSVDVFDRQGRKVASQFRATREYHADADHGIAAGSLLFRAETPALGAAIYTIGPSSQPEASEQGGIRAITEADGTVSVESDLYTIAVDTRRGGVISRLLLKGSGTECVSPGSAGLNELRGYFIEEEEWMSSAEAPAKVEIRENGPIRVTLEIAGHVGRTPFKTMLTVVQSQPRIDIHTSFNFGDRTWIGDPWDIAPEERMRERRRSHHDDRFKMLALFPADLSSPRLFKNAAYDVCESRLDDTFFQRWDTIKHNIVVNWVDLVDKTGGVGLAVLSDRTTSYCLGPNQPLGLTLAWGWEAGYWWGKCPLSGHHESRYALLPHAGLWDDALLWEAACRWSEPLIASPAAGKPATEELSLIDIRSPGVHASAMTVSGSDVLVRLFNAESRSDTHRIAFGRTPDAADLVELDGRLRSSLSVETDEDGKPFVTVPLPRFGIATLRLHGL